VHRVRGAAALVTAALGLTLTPLGGPGVAWAAGTSTNPVGNVTPSTQPASGVAVVATSAPVDGHVALLVHNGSDGSVRVDRVTATATSSDGGQVARARTRATFPQVLAPDGLALVSVAFHKKAIGVAPQVVAKVRSTGVSARHAGRVLSVGELALSAPQTGAVAQTLEATLTNPTASWTARKPAAAVMCFGESGAPATITTARAPIHRLAPGKSVTMTVDLPSLCPSYLVAARTA
jgi:hypothetical protein